MSELYALPSLGALRKRRPHKIERMLRPTSQTFRGRKLYSNGFGERFIVKSYRDSARKPGQQSQYIIDVCELNAQKEDVRYSAKVSLLQKAIYVSSFVQVQWGKPTNKSAFTEHVPTRLILNRCILLAQKHNLHNIYALSDGAHASSRLFSLGFEDVEPNSSWMVLKLPSNMQQ